MPDSTASSERSMLISLASPQAVNAPWLERQAIALEDALNAEPDFEGSSVTAHFEANGFEIDLLTKAAAEHEADAIFNKVMMIAGQTIGIEPVDKPAHQINSSFTPTASGIHDTVCV